MSFSPASANVTASPCRRVCDLHKAGKVAEAREAQESLTVLRTEIEALPMIPALKSLTRRLTREDYWRYLRPPLRGLSEDQTRELTAHMFVANLDA